MQSAFRRELSAAGWRALGFIGGLVVLAAAAGLWGSHIERRIDDVAGDRQRDHRVLRQLVAEAEAVEVPPGREGREPAPDSAGEPPTPPRPAGEPDLDDAQGDQPSQPPTPSEDPPTGKPADQPAKEDPSPPPAAPGPPSTPATKPSRSPSLLETASTTVEETVNGAGELVQGAACGLTGPLLCP